MTRLTVIMPATDGRATADACARAVADCLSPPDQLIVVREPAGSGASLARNTGARAATGDVLVFVDADVRVQADALGRIRAAFDGDPGLTALFGSYDTDPAAPGVVSQFRNLLHHHVHQEGAGPVTTFWSGLGAVRREAFTAAGGFDESLTAIEDIDLGLRLCDAGGRILLAPEVLGTHLKRWTLVSMVRTDLLHRGIPWARLMLRRRTTTGGLNLGWRHRLSALASVVGAGALVARRPPAALAAVGALLLLNRDFYRLLARRRGPAEAAAGVGLHALHHLTGVAAVVAALAGHARERRTARETIA